MTISLSSTRSQISHHSTEYSSLESRRKDKAGNEISKERVLPTLLLRGPSFGESCEIKADCYFVQICCGWCCRMSVSAVGVKDVWSVRHETTSLTLMPRPRLLHACGCAEAFAGWDHFRHDLDNVRFQCARSPKERAQ